jgi:hypothetical protein
LFKYTKLDIKLTSKQWDEMLNKKTGSMNYNDHLVNYGTIHTDKYILMTVVPIVEVTKPVTDIIMLNYVTAGIIIMVFTMLLFTLCGCQFITSLIVTKKITQPIKQVSKQSKLMVSNLGGDLTKNVSITKTGKSGKSGQSGQSGEAGELNGAFKDVVLGMREVQAARRVGTNPYYGQQMGWVSNVPDMREVIL